MTKNKLDWGDGLLKKNDKIIKIGITERGMLLIEEFERFLKESNELLNDVDNEESEMTESLREKVKKLEEILEKTKWFEEQIMIEKEKSVRPFKKYILIDKNDAKVGIAMWVMDKKNEKL